MYLMTYFKKEAYEIMTLFIMSHYMALSKIPTRGGQTSKMWASQVISNLFLLSLYCQSLIVYL